MSGKYITPWAVEFSPAAAAILDRALPGDVTCIRSQSFRTRAPGCAELIRSVFPVYERYNPDFDCDMEYLP